LTVTRYQLIALVVAWLVALEARAALTIEITKGVEGALPIAVVPFGWEGGTGPAPLDIAAVIGSDLALTGRLKVLPREDLVSRPNRADQINFSDWRVLGMDNLVVGRLLQRAPDSYEVQFQLFDVFRGEQLSGFSIPSDGGQLRRTAHHVADLIYEALTGERGAFNTRVAYVTSERRDGDKIRYELQVADADGNNPQTIVSSFEPLMSPSWSPRGAFVAYVSFEGGRPAIFVQELVTGKREQIAAYEGINGAPSWSPDGRRLTMTLSKDGNPDIYVYSRNDRSLRRLTRHYGIDTESTWSPDGRSIVFTSDRGGRPQLYRVSVNGGRPERLTFEGQYNARASFSPDGSQIAMVHGDRGRYHIAVMELETGLLRVLTPGGLDESPSFAPNGSMIIYATQESDHGVLAAVSVDGRVHQRLAVREGSVREPAWSPYEDELPR
jgi:TolB protein